MANDHFTRAYQEGRPEDLPWYHAEPDADLVALFGELLPASGARVLDLGAPVRRSTASSSPRAATGSSRSTRSPTRAPWRLRSRRSRGV